MEPEELICALRRMKTETGSLQCLGCGYEHNCGLHGCALIRAAADMIERLNDFDQLLSRRLLAEMSNLIPKWIGTKDRLPTGTDKTVLAIVSGKPNPNVTLYGAYMLANYYEDYGWVIDEYPHWEHAEVSYWMPLPEAPEEETI